MSTEKENSMSNGQRSDSQTKYGGQQNQPKFDKHDQRNNGGGKKEMESERNRDEQVTKPKENKKDDQNYNEKSDRS